MTKDLADELERLAKELSPYADKPTGTIRIDMNDVRTILSALRANHGEVEPVAWPDREAVARALHARYEERARQRGQIGGDGYTVLGGASLDECSRSLRQSFLEDADAILALFPQGETE